jgi:hypothetical protein
MGEYKTKQTSAEKYQQKKTFSGRESTHHRPHFLTLTHTAPAEDHRDRRRIQIAFSCIHQFVFAQIPLPEIQVEILPRLCSEHKRQDVSVLVLLDVRGGGEIAERRRAQFVPHQAAQDQAYTNHDLVDSVRLLEIDQESIGRNVLIFRNRNKL